MQSRPNVECAPSTERLAAIIPQEASKKFWPISSAVAIFIDSNVPMYLVGAAHPNRDRAAAFLRARPDEHYVTSAEVYQEILHRYVAIDRRAAVADAFNLLDDLMVSVFAITRADVGLAGEIAARNPSLSARNCLHLAVMQANGIDRVLTFDKGFANHPGVAILP